MRLERKNRVIARTLLNRYLNKDDDDKRTILRVHEEHNKKMYLLIGKGVAFNTYKRYETSKDHLERFIGKEFGQSDYYLKDINPEFLDKYETYFRVDRNCNNNTTAKYIKNFAKIIRWAMKNEWISNNPLKYLKLKYETVDKEYLTDEELTIITEKSIKVERIAMVRDIFVFCCYTGLAYVDAHALV
jgi:site-specific recombinase XerD